MPSGLSAGGGYRYEVVLFFLWNWKYESPSKTESDDEDYEDPISRLCAVAAERRREEETRKGKKF